MITNVDINNKTMTVIVLGEKGWVDVNSYRKSLFKMFEMATLWGSFSSCIEEGEMHDILDFIKALGIPYDKDFSEDQIIEEMKFFALEHPDSKIKDLLNQMDKKGGKV